MVLRSATLTAVAALSGSCCSAVRRGGAGAATFAAGVLVGAATVRFCDSVQLYETAADVPGRLIRKQRPFFGEVLSVADGDTLRVRHMPMRLLPRRRFTGKLSDHTIPVRIIAVDAPEIAHFGAPGQPLAEEARRLASTRVLYRMVRITPMATDQYGRIVARVRYGVFGELSSEMLRKGLAAVYRGRGASYGHRGQAWWEAIEARAQREKRGIWSRGAAATELPSEYKEAQKRLKKK